MGPGSNVLDQLKQCQRESRGKEQQLKKQQELLTKLLHLWPQRERRLFDLLGVLMEIERDNSADWLPQAISKEIRQQFANYCARYTTELRNALGQERLEGSYPHFRIRHLIEVKINERNLSALVGTRYHAFTLKQEISAETIAELVRKEIGRLFERPWQPEEFLTKLYKAYKYALVDATNGGHTRADSVPLLQVHRFMVMLQQQERVFNQGEGFRPYLPDEFAVDLGRLIESRRAEFEKKRVKLHPIRHPKEALYVITNFKEYQGLNYGLISFESREEK